MSQLQDLNAATSGGSDLTDLLGKIDDIMQKITTVAVNTRSQPLNCLDDMLIAVGVKYSDRQVLLHKGHEYLWEHRQELPWKINMPN